MPKNRQVQVRVDASLYAQIAALAQEGNRPVAREVATALRCYIEKAIRGSQRWHELGGQDET